MYILYCIFRRSGSSVDRRIMKVFTCPFAVMIPLNRRTAELYSNPFITSLLFRVKGGAIICWEKFQSISTTVMKF